MFQTPQKLEIDRHPQQSGQGKYVFTHQNPNHPHHRMPGMVEHIAFPHSYSMKAAFVLVKSVIFLGTKFKPWMIMDGRYMGSQEFVASGFVWVSVSLGRRP